MEDFGYRLELSKLPRVDAASSAGGRETEERGRVISLSLEDVREAEREKERERGTSARETEKRRVESLPEEKEEEEGQSGSGNDRPSALEANIDECPALLALRNQQSEERGIALFPFSPPSLASSPTSSTDPPPPPPFRFFSTFGFRLSAFGKRRGINGSPISPLSSRIRRRKPRQREKTNKGPFFRRDSPMHRANLARSSFRFSTRRFPESRRDARVAALRRVPPASESVSRVCAFERFSRTSRCPDVRAISSFTRQLAVNLDLRGKVSRSETRRDEKRRKAAAR